MRIKASPEDFIVEEVIGLDLIETGPYTIYRVTKRDRNTEDVAFDLARACGVSRKAVGYAGTKDKRAVTTQYFSVRGGHAPGAVAGCAITTVGQSIAPLALGMLTANRFTITVDAEPRAWELPPSVPNYFDEQRFGSQNAAVGKALVRKEFGTARALLARDAVGSRFADVDGADHVTAIRRIPRQTLRLYLHAYQSLLFNRVLAEYVEEHDPNADSVAYSQGELRFPSVEIPDTELQLPGFGSETDERAARVLEAEGVTSRDFVIRQLPNLSLEGSTRRALIRVEEFSVEEGARPTFSFTLPKGSYATIVLKAIAARSRGRLPGSPGRR